MQTQANSKFTAALKEVHRVGRGLKAAGRTLGEAKSFVHDAARPHETKSFAKPN